MSRMNIARTVILLLIAAATPSLEAAAPTGSASTAVDLHTLRENFINPPATARPMVRWWWFGLAVQKPEILAELQQMKADGIGGAELAFEYPQVLDDPQKGLINLPFLSPEMLDDVKFAQAEGRTLGLRIDVTLGSGWPYGGRNTTLEEAAGMLRAVEVPVPPNTTSVAVPTLARGESLISAFTADSVARPAQDSQTTAGRHSAHKPVDWDASSAAPIKLSGDDVPGVSVAIAPAARPRVALFLLPATPGSRSSAPPQARRDGCSIPSAIRRSPRICKRSANLSSRPSAALHRMPSSPIRLRPTALTGRRTFPLNLKSGTATI